MSHLPPSRVTQGTVLGRERDHSVPLSSWLRGVMEWVGWEGIVKIIQFPACLPPPPTKSLPLCRGIPFSLKSPTLPGPVKPFFLHGKGYLGTPGVMTLLIPQLSGGCREIWLSDSFPPS